MVHAVVPCYTAFIREGHRANVLLHGDKLWQSFR